MAIKCANYDGEPKFSEKLWRLHWNKDYLQADFDHIIDSNNNVGIRVDLMEKMEESFERAPANLKKYSKSEY